MTHPGRNDPCPCGSGKKYKHCHYGKPDDPWKPQGTALPVDPYYDPYADTFYGGSSYPNFDPGAETLADDDKPWPGIVAIPPDPSKPALVIDPGFFAGSGELDDEPWDESDADFDLELDDYEPTPLDEAWDLIDMAWDEPSPRQRKKLAKSALKESKECAGAYFILGQTEGKERKRIELFGQAIEVARRALEPETLEDLTPYQWEDPSVESAMYAMLYRALTWYTSEQTNKALDDLDALLALDPLDRLRARPLKFLIQLENGAAADAEQTAMIDRTLYGADPVCMYGLALARFRRSGDTPFARRALADAVLAFPDLIDMLRGKDDPKFMSSVMRIAEEIQAIEAELGVEDVEASTDQVPDATDDWDEEFDGDWPMSSIDEAPALLAVATHIKLWQLTDGAAEWLRGVHDAGPKIRYDNGNLGEGPMLRFANDLPRDFRRCPSCNRKTDSHDLDLVLAFSDGAVVDVELKARRCDHCDLVSVDFDDMQRHILVRYPGWESLEFVPLGFIARTDKSARPAVPAEDWLQQHMQPFRRIDDGDWARAEWPTREEHEQELQRVLQDAGIADLLGPQASHGLGLFPGLRP